MFNRNCTWEQFIKLLKIDDTTLINIIDTQPSDDAREWADSILKSWEFSKYGNYKIMKHTKTKYKSCYDWLHI